MITKRFPTMGVMFNMQLKFYNKHRDCPDNRCAYTLYNRCTVFDIKQTILREIKL